MILSRLLTSSAHRALIVSPLVALLPTAPGLAQCPGVWASGLFSIGNTGMPASVNDLATGLDGSIYAVGAFTTAGGVAANRVARWNGLWAPLGTGLSGSAYAATLMANGDLIVGGNFTTAGGVTVNNIARWNGSAWSALGSGIGGFVYCLAVKPNNEIVVSGSFSTAGGSPATYVARWNGSLWIALGSGVDSNANAVVVMPNGDIITGGQFLHAGGNPVSRIARFDGSTWSPLTGPFGEGVDGVVHALLAQSDGSVIVGGVFNNAGGVPAKNIARWTPAGGGAWSAMGAGLGSQVMALRRLSSGTVMAGGHFVFDGTLAGTPLNRIARWDGTNWQPVGVGTNNVVWTITGTNHQSDSFTIGGDFSTAGGATAVRVAQFNATAAPTITRQPTATVERCGSAAHFVTLTAPAPVGFQWRKGGVNLSDGATASGSVISGSTAPVLTIAPVTAADAANYDCVVTMNGGCAATTSAASLTTSGCCPADFDGSGTVNSADVAAYINAWFAALTSGC